MKRPTAFVLTFVLAGLLLAGVSSGVASAADQPLTVVSVDTSAAPRVRAVVAAPPQLAGQTLAASAFSVNEGSAHPAVAVDALPADQLEVALVVDTSGSMAGAPLAAAKTAAAVLLGQLPTSVPVAVVGFGATPTLASARSQDRAAQVAAVNALQARGETSLYDAVLLGARQLSSGGTVRRFVVLVSDGGDTTSAATLDQAVAQLSAARTTVFAVGLTTPESNPGALARLTSATGGQSVAAADPNALGGLFDGIAKQLVRQYAVSWTSAGRGATDATLTLDANGVRATSAVHLELPAAAQPPATAAQAATGGAGATDSGGGAFLLGSALICLALLAALLPSLVLRTPRSRALSGGRWASASLSVRAVTDRTGHAVDRVLRNRAPAGVAGLLERAGVDLRPGELLLAVGSASAVAVAVLAFTVGPVAGVIIGGAVLGAARLALGLRVQRRRRAFADQLGDTLQMLAGSLRAGYGVAQAIDVVAREAESPTAEEFRRLVVEIRLGRDFNEALRAMSGRLDSQDFEWVVQAFEIHHEVGGDLAEVLDRVSATMRDRNRVRRQVIALSAEGRMSALVLFVLPFILAAVTSVLDPSYLHELTSSGAGITLLAGGGVLMTVGGLWLRHIVRPQF